MKKFICGLLIGLLVSIPVATMGGQALRLIVNGEDITSQAQPVIIDGRTLVPARALAEKLGASVEWDGANQTVTVNSIVKAEAEPEQDIPNPNPSNSSYTKLTEVYRIGDTVDLGDTQIKVLSTEYSERRHEFTAWENHTFFSVTFEVITTQIPTYGRYFHPTRFTTTVITDDGIKYGAPSSMGRDVQSVYPNQRTTCTVTYSVEKGDAIKQLIVINGSAQFAEATVTFD